MNLQNKMGYKYGVSGVGLSGRKSAQLQVGWRNDYTKLDIARRPCVYKNVHVEYLRNFGVYGERRFGLCDLFGI